MISDALIFYLLKTKDVLSALCLDDVCLWENNCERVELIVTPEIVYNIPSDGRRKEN